MKKYMVYGIWYIAIFDIVFFNILHTTYYILPIKAADSTQSAQTSSSSADIKDKIDAIKKEIASKAAALVPDVNKKLANKVYSGMITEITDNKFTILSENEQKIININEYTTFEDQTKKNSKTKKASLSIKVFSKDDFVAGLGDVDDKGGLIAKKIIRLDPVKIPEVAYFWGQIESSNNSRIILKLKDYTKQDILTEWNTDFFLGKEESSFLDAKPGKFMVARAKKSKDKSFFADYIYFIPTAGFIKPEPKIATSSAASTPSASIKND